MKKIALIAAIASLTVVACKKKDDNPSPSSSTSTNVMAKISANVDSQDSLRVTVTYTEKNTEEYRLDMLKLYIDDKYIITMTIDPQKPNTSYYYTPRMRYAGTKYKLNLMREYEPGSEVLVANLEGK